MSQVTIQPIWQLTFLALYLGNLPSWIVQTILFEYPQTDEQFAENSIVSETSKCHICFLFCTKISNFVRLKCAV